MIKIKLNNIKKIGTLQKKMTTLENFMKIDIKIVFKSHKILLRINLSTVV